MISLLSPLHPNLTVNIMDAQDRKREIAEQKERAAFKRKKFEQERFLHDAEYYDVEDMDAQSLER